MMRFNLTISCDNDAFTDDPSAEVAAVLVRVVAQLAQADSGTVLDSNGNSVGTWGFDLSDEEVAGGHERPTVAIDGDGDQWSLYPDGTWRTLGVPDEPSLAAVEAKYGPLREVQ